MGITLWSELSEKKEETTDEQKKVSFNSNHSGMPLPEGSNHDFHRERDGPIVKPSDYHGKSRGFISPPEPWARKLKFFHITWYLRNWTSNGVILFRMKKWENDHNKTAMAWVHIMWLQKADYLIGPQFGRSMIKEVGETDHIKWLWT